MPKMSNTLRDIIATVLIAHPDHPHGTCCGAPDLEIEYQQDWALHVADAIIQAMIYDAAERWKNHPDNREFGAE